MGVADCGKRFLSVAVRITNAIVTLMGMALAAYGAYLAAKAHGVSSLSGVTLGLGIIDALMGGLMICCLHRIFAIRLYIMLVGAATIAQAVVCGLFLSPTYQSKIIDDINGSQEFKDWVSANLKSAGYFLIAMVAFQALTLLLVLGQCMTVNKGFDESAWDTDTSKLVSSGARADKLISKGDRYAALRDEGLADAATARAHDKYASYYEKYSRK